LGRARNARINLGRPDAQWESEDMHAGRVMGDMLILPAGDMLLLNGAAPPRAALAGASGGSRS